MKIPAQLAVSVLLSGIGNAANAKTCIMPENGNDSVITQFRDHVPLTRAEQDVTLLDVARCFLPGQAERLPQQEGITGLVGQGFHDGYYDGSSSADRNGKIQTVEQNQLIPH